MEKNAEFDDIRPYNDNELLPIMEELISDPEFRQVASAAIPGIPFETLAHKMRLCNTKRAFQETFCYDFLWKLVDNCCTDISLDHTSLADKTEAYTYISNHRDIILDSGFLSILLVRQGMNTVEIAIGDNLLAYPWIKKLVRINKSFIVQRSLPMRQMLEASGKLSRYMHYAIAEKKESIWIAQREGRAKDSNDYTQESLLKMLAIAGQGSVPERLKSLNIVPLSISYEYDPCDYLKAREFQLKRDMPDYKKTTRDDLKNMETGLFGFKGRVHFKTAQCLNEELDKLDRSLPRQALLSMIATIMDNWIHRNYQIYPGNYVAYDLLDNSTRFSSRYTPDEKEQFESYLQKQLDKIDIPHKDEAFLRGNMLAMYANPLINHIKAVNS